MAICENNPLIHAPSLYGNSIPQRSRDNS